MKKLLYVLSLLIVASMVLAACGLPIILFFAAQRFFIQGIVVTGVEK